MRGKQNNDGGDFSLLSKSSAHQAVNTRPRKLGGREGRNLVQARIGQWRCNALETYGSRLAALALTKGVQVL